MSAKTAWLTAAVVAFIGPVVAWLFMGGGAPVSFWDDLAVISGAQAASLFVYTIALISRSRSATNAFGIDGVVDLHRFVGISLVALILLHVFAVIAADPQNVWLLSGVDVPPRAAAGFAALIVLGLLIGLTRYRRWFSYEVWRRWHVGLAVAALILVTLHVVFLSRLIWVAGWVGVFVTLGALGFGVLAHRWLWRPLRGAYGFVVLDVRPLSPSASTAVLRPLSGHRWAFQPGQFAWLRLRRSVLAEDHPFSMCSAPGRTVQFMIAHRGDWTGATVHALLRPGRRVWLDGPHGSVTLDRADDARTIVMIATGVGIAPMLSMLRAMEARQDTREVTLIVPPKYLMADEIYRLSWRVDLGVAPVLSRSVSPSTIRNCLPANFDDCCVFVCGSPSLIEDMTRELDVIGFPSGRVHAERFGLAADLERADA